MSRDDNGYTSEQRTARALERIAETLDDFLDLSLGTVEATHSQMGGPVDPALVLEHVAGVVGRIRQLRRER